MTRLYTFRAATLTMARFVSPRLGASSKLCPVNDCVWPAGSRCTMSLCPGNSLSNNNGVA